MSANMASNTAWASSAPGGGAVFSRRITRNTCSATASNRPSSVSGTPRVMYIYGVAGGGHRRRIQLKPGALVAGASAKETGQTCL